MEVRAVDCFEDGFQLFCYRSFDCPGVLNLVKREGETASSSFSSTEPVIQEMSSCVENVFPKRLA